MTQATDCNGSTEYIYSTIGLIIEYDFRLDVLAVVVREQWSSSTWAFITAPPHQLLRSEALDSSRIRPRLQGSWPGWGAPPLDGARPGLDVARK